MQEPIIEVAFVFVAIFEGDGARAIEALSIDFGVLGRYRNRTMPIRVQYFGELDGQHHFMVHLIERWGLRCYIYETCNLNVRPCPLFYYLRLGE
jgi:hypothetical protein